MVKEARIILAVVWILGVWSTEAPAEIQHDLEFILSHHPPGDVIRKTPVSRGERKHVQELKLVLGNTIRFYQLFISSQDIPGCSFTPSCSRYSRRAMEKFGIFYGGLMCSDRLLRCNGLGHKHHYPVHPQTGKFADPVEANFLWDK